MRERDEELVMHGPTCTTTLCAGLVLINAMVENVSEIHGDSYFPVFYSNSALNCPTYLMIPALQNAFIWDLAREFLLSPYAAKYMSEDASRTRGESGIPRVTVQAV